MTLKRPPTIYIVIVVLIILNLFVVHYLLTNSSDDGVNKSATNTVSISQSLKTYCSDYGYLCFDYPKGWKLATFSTDDEAISPETTTVISPSKKVVVTYRPNFGVTDKKEANSISVIGIDTTRASDLKVVTLIDKYNGSGITDIPYTPEMFVTNNLQADSGDFFAAGTTVTSDKEPVFHTYTPRNNAKVTSYFYVKYDQDSAYNRTNTGHYASYEQALAVLDGSESKVARQILQSARYKD